MKNVLVLNQFALPRSESGGTRHVDLFSRLPGWSPRIVAGSRNYTTQETYKCKDERFTLLHVPRHSKNGLLRILGWGMFATQATAIGITRRNVDLVYASTPQLLAPVAGIIVARARRIPLIVEVRDLWPESIVGTGSLREGSLMHKALLWLEKRIYASADHIVVVTPGWEQHFDQLGIKREKLSVIPNGTEVEEFEVSEDREKLRAEFGLCGPTAVYAGAHGPANALDLLVDAARELPDLTVLLVGSGTEKARLQREARDLPNVRFLDPLPKSQLARVLAAADFGIHCIEALPVLARGMSPNKLFDYMAAGLPTVSNAGEGLRGILADGECGHTGGPDSLLRSLRLVMAASAEERAVWSSRGREIVEQRFSRSGAAKTLAHLLDRQLHHQRPPHGSQADVVHLTTAHKATDNRIFRKEAVLLAQAGFKVNVVAVHAKDEVIDDVQIRALPYHTNRLRRMILGPIDAHRVLRRLRPRVVHIHDPELIPLGLAWKATSGSAVIFDAHEDLPRQVMGKPYLPSWIRSPVARFARSLELAADRCFDAIVAATPAIERNFRNPNKTLVQNFPWLRDFPFPTPYNSAAPWTFSYVGGLTKERGALEMLDAVDDLDQSSLTVAGPVTPEVKRRLDRSRNSTYRGILSADEVPKIVSGAQVGCVLFHPLPNHLECQPTKLFEYMAAGRPFIASDFPFWRSLFDEHECGVFVDPTSTSEIRDAARFLMANPAEAEQMGMRGRRAVEETFNFESEGKRLVALISKLLRS